MYSQRTRQTAKKIILKHIRTAGKKAEEVGNTTYKNLTSVSKLHDQVLLGRGRVKRESDVIVILSQSACKGDYMWQYSENDVLMVVVVWDENVLGVLDAG
jgi:hypothetical protein